MVQIKFFHLPEPSCDCGEPSEVVRLAVTKTSSVIVSVHCMACATQQAADLTANGFHSLRGEGSLLNEAIFPEPLAPEGDDSPA